MIEVPKPLRRHFDFLATALAVVVLSFVAGGEAQAVSFCPPGPGDVPETGLQGSLSLADRTRPGGFQGQWCGARKVAQHALFDRGSYGETQIKDNCAYASMRDPSNLNALTTGLVVLDARTPGNLVIPADTANPPNPKGRMLRT